MSQKNNELDRRVRIELLRARAAYEREQICYQTRQLSQTLTPKSLFGLLSQGIGTKFAAKRSGGHWLDFALSFSQRYPLMLSSVSAVAGTLLGRKKWRLGALALTAWRLYGAYQGVQQRKKDSYVQAQQPKSGRVMGPF